MILCVVAAALQRNGTERGRRSGKESVRGRGKGKGGRGRRDYKQ